MRDQSTAEREWGSFHHRIQHCRRRRGYASQDSVAQRAFGKQAVQIVHEITDARHKLLAWSVCTLACPRLNVYSVLACFIFSGKDPS